MHPSLSDTVGIVTGSGRGIGAASARSLAEAGAAVMLTARTEAELKAVKSEIESAGGKAEFVVADMAKPEDLDNIVNTTVERFGGVDFLVNNAGMPFSGTLIHEYTLEDWELALAVNLRSCWYLSKLVHPILKSRGGGALVNIASNSGLHSNIGLGLYGITKAGLIFLTTVCAKEWARDKIRVNCIAPGLVKTRMADAAVEYLKTKGKQPNPLNLLAEPEDIAKMVHYLVSEDARYITGETIRMDGGEIL